MNSTNQKRRRKNHSRLILQEWISQNPKMNLQAIGSTILFRKEEQEPAGAFQLHLILNLKFSDYTRKKVKLSEMYTVYWEYVEKARRYIKERGNSAFEEGSEANAVPRMWKMYGVVPDRSLFRTLPGQTFHDHKEMHKEMKSYLENIKATFAWDEDEAIKVIKSIMNHYMGEPPTEFYFEGYQIFTKRIPE